MAAKDRPGTIRAAKLMSMMFPDSEIEQNLKDGLCPTCGIKVNPMDFRDSPSLKEFALTGMCQTCQDKTFAQSTED